MFSFLSLRLCFCVIHTGAAFKSVTYSMDYNQIFCYMPKEKSRLRRKENLRSVPGSGRRSLICLIRGLWVSDELPAGGRVAYVSGTPATARSRKEAKAEGAQKTRLRSDL